MFQKKKVSAVILRDYMHTNGEVPHVSFLSLVLFLGMIGSPTPANEHACSRTEHTFTRANFPKGFHFWYLNRSFSGVIPDQIYIILYIPLYELTSSIKPVLATKIEYKSPFLKNSMYFWENISHTIVFTATYVILCC